MSIFYNIRAQFVEDVPYLVNLISLHKPRWALVMDGVGLAKQLKAASPTTNVIHRAWPDDQTNLGAKEWVDKKISEIDGAPLWAYTYNEIGLQADRTIAIIKECVARGWPINLVIGNVSVGTPDPKEWDDPKVKELLQLADKYRDHVVLGLHEYAHGVITSGLQDKHFELNSTLWPSVIDENKNNWHMGRFKFMVQACKRNGINPPRVVITEHGFDSLGDMKDMLPGGGWHTLENYWATVFPNMKPEEAYAMQLIYANRVIYSYGNIVEGQLIFQYGGKESGLWNAFDVEKARTLHNELAKAEGAIVNPPTTPPVEDTHVIVPVVISAADKTVPVRFRKDPSLGDSSTIIGYIKDPVEAYRFEGETVTAGGWTFAKFRIGNQDGWAALELLLIKTPEEAANISITVSQFVDIKTRMNNLKTGLAVLNTQANELETLIASFEK